MKTRRIIVNYYDTEEERDKKEMKARENDLNILYKSKIEEK